MEIKELKSSALFLAWPWEIIFNFLLSSRSVILLEKLSNSRLETHNWNKYILALFLKIRFSFLIFWIYLRSQARRAWRTKSSRPEGSKAGPKSRYLEVGPGGAPRLLVCDFCGGQGKRGAVRSRRRSVMSRGKGRGGSGGWGGGGGGGGGGQVAPTD